MSRRHDQFRPACRLQRRPAGLPAWLPLLDACSARGFQLPKPGTPLTLPPLPTRPLPCSYVNLHTTEFPSGVIRSQVMWKGVATSVPAEAPAPEATPTTSAAAATSGRGAILLLAAALAAAFL